MIFHSNLKNVGLSNNGVYPPNGTLTEENDDESMMKLWISRYLFFRPTQMVVSSDMIGME